MRLQPPLMKTVNIFFRKKKKKTGLPALAILNICCRSFTKSRKFRTKFSHRKIPNQEILLTNIIETIADVRKSSDDLLNLKISTKVLAITQTPNMFITSECNVPGLPDVDPGKRSSKLTDSQKEYILIVVGPYNLCFRYIRTMQRFSKKVINKHLLIQDSTKSIHIWSTVWLKLQRFALFASCLIAVVVQTKQRTHGIRTMFVVGISLRVVESRRRVN